MKHLNLTIQSLLFTILLSGVVTSCQFTPKSMDSLLDRVEGCMEAHPDSALQLLESVTEPEKMSEESLARYYLLLTQARDKNYQDLSSDSSIIYSVNYFKDHDDPSRYGKSMYYYGRVMQMCDEDIRAMKIYLEAQNALKEAGEYKMLGLLSENMAILNRNQSLYTEAIHCSQKAIGYYYEAKDTLGVADAYQTLRNTFFLIQPMDSLKKGVDRSLSFFDTNPVRLTVSADKLLGLVYSYQKQYEEAERLFLKVLAEEPNESKKIRHYLSLGHLYQMMGRKQEAEKYLDVCLKDDDLLVRSEAYSCLSDMAVSDSDIKQAFYFKQMADSLFYIVENDRKRDAIAHLQTENVKERFLRKSLQIEMDKRKMHSFVFVVSVLFVAGLYLLYNKYASTKLQVNKLYRRLEENMNRNSIYRDQVEVYSRLLSEHTQQTELRIKELKDKISVLTEGKENTRQMQEKDKCKLIQYQKEIELLKQQQLAEKTRMEAEIGTLTQKITELENTSHELIDLMDVEKLITMLKEGKIIAENMIPEEWDRIYNLVNCLYDNVLSKLKNKYPHLTSHDINLLSFLLLDFSNKELIIIFDSIGSNTLSHAKLRLKERLELEKDVKLDDFLRKIKKNKSV